jgi:hypothetical protein
VAFVLPRCPRAEAYYWQEGTYNLEVMDMLAKLVNRLNF